MQLELEILLLLGSSYNFSDVLNKLNLTAEKSDFIKALFYGDHSKILNNTIISSWLMPLNNLSKDQQNLQSIIDILTSNIVSYIDSDTSTSQEKAFLILAFIITLFNIFNQANICGPELDKSLLTDYNLGFLLEHPRLELQARAELSLNSEQF